jgi:hypothetical protein
MNLTGYVEPPTDLVAYSWAEPFFCGLMGLIVLVALVWAIAKREWILVALLPAAAVSSLIEPFYDYVGGAWWATNLSTSFTAFDGRIFSPYFFPLGYASWVGLGAYASYRIFSKRPRRSRMLIGFAAVALAEPILELPWIHTHLFSYYGPQPFKMFGYSLVWCAINTAGVAFAGTVLLAMSSKLRGWGAMRAAVVPFMVIGSYFACAWPIWLAYQAGAPVPVLWAAGTITIAICIAQVYALTGYVAGQSSVHPGKTAQLEDKIPADSAR